MMSSRCFAVLGIDIMIDEKLKPYLIEVNHLPSFGTDSPIDEEIKSKVIGQALASIQVNSRDKHDYETRKKKESKTRLFGRNSSSCISSEMLDQNSKGRVFLEGNDHHHHPLDFKRTRNNPKINHNNTMSFEERIAAVYQLHAPEKIDKVKDLLQKYRGYEEWLVRQVEEKYSSQSSAAASNQQQAAAIPLEEEVVQSETNTCSTATKKDGENKSSECNHPCHEENNCIIPTNHNNHEGECSSCSDEESISCEDEFDAMVAEAEEDE
eukprot:6048901-Ditylum_brightwellii.AAC.1